MLTKPFAAAPIRGAPRLAPAAAEGPSARPSTAAPRESRRLTARMSPRWAAAQKRSAFAAAFCWPTVQTAGAGTEMQTRAMPRRRRTPTLALKSGAGAREGSANREQYGDGSRRSRQLLGKATACAVCGGNGKTDLRKEQPSKTCLLKPTPVAGVGRLKELPRHQSTALDARFGLTAHGARGWSWGIPPRVLLPQCPINEAPRHNPAQTELSVFTRIVQNVSMSAALTETLYSGGQASPKANSCCEIREPSKSCSSFRTLAM